MYAEAEVSDLKKIDCTKTMLKEPFILFQMNILKSSSAVIMLHSLSICMTFYFYFYLHKHQPLTVCSLKKKTKADVHHICWPFVTTNQGMTFKRFFFFIMMKYRLHQIFSLNGIHHFFKYSITLA